MRSKALELLADGSRTMSRTDVKNYYPTLNSALLERNLVCWGCDPHATDHLIGLVETWNEGYERTGIPMGPEAFGVVGNAYLLPLDVRLTAQSDVVHLRWMDDIYVLGASTRETRNAVDVSDHEMLLLGLTRSEEKTKHFQNSAEARDEIHDAMLASLFDQLDRDTEKNPELLRRRFHEYVVEVEEPLASRFRGILKAMTFRRDDYAARWLAENPGTIEIDPMVAADYFRAVALANSPVTDLLFLHLLDTQVRDRDRHDARDLHLLRALSDRVWGRDEGEVFKEIAMDESRRGPVRAWAMAAYAKTAGWKMDDAMERTLEESDPYVRRAFLASLRRAIGDGRCRRFVLHIRGLTNDLFACTLWIDR